MLHLSETGSVRLRLCVGEEGRECGCGDGGSGSLDGGESTDTGHIGDKTRGCEGEGLGGGGGAGKPRGLAKGDEEAEVGAEKGKS